MTVQVWKEIYKQRLKQLLLNTYSGFTQHDVSLINEEIPLHINLLQGVCTYSDIGTVADGNFHSYWGFGRGSGTMDNLVCVLTGARSNTASRSATHGPQSLQD